MFCANCRLIFQQDHFDYGNWTREDDRQHNWCMRHSYGISCGDFLLAAAKCHCCHELLRQFKLDDPLSAGSAQEELRIRLEWEVLVYGFPDTTGHLSVRANFRNPDFCEQGYSSAKAEFRMSILRKFRNTGEHNDIQVCDVISDTPINSTSSNYTAQFVKSYLEHCKSYYTVSRYNQGI